MQVTSFTSGRITSFAVSRDCKRLSLARGSNSSDVVLIRTERKSRRQKLPILGRLQHLVKCPRIWLAVSLAPQRQPQCIRRPGGRPRFAFERFNISSVCPRSAAKGGEGRRTWSEIAGLLGHIVKWARIWCSVRQAPHPQPHGICGPRGRPMRLNGLKIDSRTRLAQRRHRPETHRSQNG
jgi:hypothetical protein